MDSPTLSERDRADMERHLAEIDRRFKGSPYFYALRAAVYYHWNDRAGMNLEMTKCMAQAADWHHIPRREIPRYYMPASTFLRCEYEHHGSPN